MDEYISIHEFAYRVKRTVPGIRNLVEHGNRVDILPHKYSGRTILIPIEQLYIFPFVEKGNHKSPNILHYTEGKGLTVCPECTEGKRCKRLGPDGHWNGIGGEQ